MKTEKKQDSNFSRMSNQNLIEILPFVYGTKKEPIQDIKKPITSIKETLYVKDKDIKEVCLNDFNTLYTIGKGSFGDVTLVEYKSTKELFAMKSINKEVLLKFEQVENALLEKKILQTLEHPFLLSLTFCFQTEATIYFVMPFIK